MGRHQHGDEALIAVLHVAQQDISRCLEARLDRKKLPKPSANWAEADRSLVDFMERAAMEFEETQRVMEIEDAARD